MLELSPKEVAVDHLRGNKQPQLVIHYLITENQVLREVCGMKRILLTDEQRRRLKRFLH
jgi:hypothetical protein